MKKTLLIVFAAGIVATQDATAQWQLNGNAGTTPASQFIGTTDSVGFRIRTNNQVRVGVTADGRVGIGTASPSYALDVKADDNCTVRLKSQVSGSSNMVIDRATGTDNCLVNYKTGGADNWRTGCAGNSNFVLKNPALGTDALTVSSASNAVGIGTSTPAAALDVKSANSYTAQFNGGSSMYIGLFENDVYRGYLGSYSGSAADLDFGTGTGNTTGKVHLTIQGTPRMTLSSGGQVGIGTTAPNYYLDIQASAADRALNASSSYVGSIGQIINFERTSVPSAANDIVQITVPAGSPSDFQFIECDKAASNRFQVNGDGSTGIGQSTLSTARLNVDGSNAENKKLYGIYSTTDSVSSSSVGIYGVHELVGSNVDAKGVYGKCVANPGYGYGMYGEGGYRGVYGVGSGSTYTGTAYGVYGNATGSTAGTRIGIYGTASGGSSSEANWGGYFPTKVYTTQIRVGTTAGATGYIACIGGKLIAEEVRVALEADWPDYVFSNDYKMLSLDELEEYVKEFNHLPGVPSACEVQENGLMLGQMSGVIMEKTEENTLYILQLKNEINELKKRLSQLENK